MNVLGVTKGARRGRIDKLYDAHLSDWSDRERLLARTLLMIMTGLIIVSRMAVSPESTEFYWSLSGAGANVQMGGEPRSGACG